MRSLRLGMIFVMTGLFFPLICLPLAGYYRKAAGLVANLQSMSVQITKDTREPDFRVVDSLEHEENIILVEYGKDTTIGFPESLSKGEMELAMRAEVRLEKNPRPKFMRFYGWRVTYEGTRIPYRFIASLGAFLVFVGSVIIVANARRKSSPA